MKKITQFVHGMQAIYAAIPTFDKIIIAVMIFIIAASCTLGFMLTGQYILFVVCLLITALAAAEWERQTYIHTATHAEEEQPLTDG